MSLDRPILLTENYLQTKRAQAVPEAYFEGGGWWIPPDPDPETARYAIRLFKSLAGQYPELVARARLSVSDDYTPPDRPGALWVDRPVSEDPWPIVTAACTAEGITPHRFQRTDAQWAVANLDAGKGAYLGHAVGLGKSLTSLMVCEAWPSNFVFIACPNSAKHDPWVEHLERFAPWLHPVVVGNTPKTRAAALDEAKQRLDAGAPTALICHHEAIALIEGEKRTGWKRFGQWDLLIVDEAHVFKGRNSKRAAAVRRLSRAGTLLLSGSVLSAGAEHLFVPLQILQPRRYRSAWRDWNDRYLDAVQTDYSLEIIGPKAHTLDAMRDELADVLVVRQAKDHLRVPEPVVVEHTVQLLPPQKKAYLELANELLAELPDGTLLSASKGTALLTALRRVTGGVPTPDGAGLLSAKHDRALEIIEAGGDSQVLAFTWHRAPAEELQRRCREAGIPCGLVYGSLPDGEREREIDLYKRQGYRVLVATLAALSTAANLQNTEALVFIEHSFSPVDQEQAIGRAVRQGQQCHVSVHHIAAADTVDATEVIPAALSKAALRKMVLGF